MYRDRKVKKQIRQLQEKSSNNEKPAQEVLHDESSNPIQEDFELETGIDRAELRAGHDRHEAPNQQLYELI